MAATISHVCNCSVWKWISCILAGMIATGITVQIGILNNVVTKDQIKDPKYPYTTERALILERLDDNESSISRLDAKVDKVNTSVRIVETTQVRMESKLDQVLGVN